MFEGPLRYIVVLVLVIIVLRMILSYSRTRQPDQGRKSDERIPVVYNDGVFDEGIKAANASFPLFQQVLREDAGIMNASLKMAFPHDGPGGAEHIWIKDLQFIGDKLHGKVANDPINVKNLQYGDEVTVVPERVSDWRYSKDGLIYGGWTIYDALLPSLTANQLAELEKALGGKFSERALLPPTERTSDV